MIALPASVGLVGPVSSGGSGDPYFANVVALLHFDGADGSTTMTDVTGKTWTPFGNAQIDTGQSKFGGSSLLLDGSGDYLTTPSSADFAYGTGDFTWEGWIRPTATSGGANKYILEHGSNGGTVSILASNGRISYYNSTTGTGVGSIYDPAGGSVAVNTWHHFAYARQSGTTRAFLNGTLLGANVSDTHNYAAQAVSIGRYGGGGLYFFGNIDEIRITKGVARYTAAFTPPTAPFPDS